MFPRAASPLGRKGILRGPTPRFGCLRFDQRIAPTADAEGSILVLCSKCDHQDTIVLPALDAKNYQVTVTIAAGCQSEGEAIYVYTDKTYGYTYKTTVVLPMLGHTEYVEGKTKTYTWIIDNAEYTGYICETCGQMIVVNVTEMNSYVP